MYTVERREWLIDRARRDGRLDVGTLSEELKLAPETIRRDLNDLERQGMVRRVHGGAVPVERLKYESGLSTRAERQPAQKKRIAEAAVKHIGTAEAIFIDEGNLPQQVADQLHPTRPITVVTSSLPVAMLLATRPNIESIVLGGVVRSKTFGCVDHWAQQTLRGLVLDLAFIGANGVTLEHGPTVPDGAVAAVKVAAMHAARRRILIADSTKIGTNSFLSIGRLLDFERFVTDSDVSDSAADRIASSGLTIERA